MSGRATWIGFLAVAFAVVGLSGLFATYAMSAPWRRAALEITALDGAGPVEARIEAALGSEAARRRLAPPGTSPDAALQAARAAVLHRAEEDATSAETRTRWLIVIVTVMGAAFGAAVLGAGQGAHPDRLPAPRPDRA